MRPGGHASAREIKRILEAAQSWLTLWEIWNQFGPERDGPLPRNMRSAEDRLMEAIRDYESPPKGML